MDDIRKSINAILYDRIVSPLSGSFIISWCTINWRIFYATIFQTSEELKKNKIEFVEGELNISNGLIWPLVSTVLLITIFPWLSEFAYQLSLYYRSRKRKLKNKYEEKQLLTLEQSIEIRLQLKSQLERVEKMTSDKDEIVATLKAENEGLINRLAVFEQRVRDNQALTKGGNQREKESGEDDDYLRFNSDENNQKILSELYHKQPVWSNSGFGSENLKVIKTLELLDLVSGKLDVTDGSYSYTISDKGKSFLKRTGAK